MRNRQEVQDHPLDDWESFEAKVAEIDRETCELKRTRALHVSEPLYRGQRDAMWPLATTLDRRKRGMTLDKYLSIMERIRPQIERVSGIKWPDLGREIAGLRQNGLDSIWRFPIKSANTETILSFMVYLRQHGFPSPLLDWTSDPYRAAFFAFAGVEENEQKVAIFTFREWAGLAPEWRSEDEPTAMGIGPCIGNTSPRHSKQHAQYTWCAKKSSSGAGLDYYVFTDHEQVMNRCGFSVEDGICVDMERAQNLVDKYTIPSSEQRKALTRLAQRGINKCTLFGHSADDLLVDLWNEVVADSTV
jgi:hypothetical protein